MTSTHASSLSFKTISLGDQRYFELLIGERIVQRDVDRLGGTIPVYSGNVSIPFVKVRDTVTIKDFERDYVIWGIDDANFDFGYIPQGTQFDITDHCGAIKILDPTISASYIFYELRAQKKSLRFNWMRRPNLQQMAKVVMKIPVRNDGSFDVTAQDSYARKYLGIQTAQEKLRQTQERLKAIEFEVSDKEIDKHITLNLNDTQNFMVDNGERIRKEDIELATGDVPVYSSSKYENEVLGLVSDDIKSIVPKAKYFDGTNLTVAADGSVGSVFVRNGKFYANDVCNVITIVNPQIDPYFVKYELRTQIYKMRLTWGNKLYKDRLKKISIRIPIDEKGGMDLERQQSLVKKYQHGELLRDSMIRQIGSLIEAKVVL